MQDTQFNPQDIITKTKRALTVEELTNLRVFKASTPQGSVLFIPRIKKYGQEIVWEARTHVRGAMGPVSTTRASLKAIGAPEDWGEKVPAFLRALQGQFPSLPGVSQVALGGGGQEGQ